MRKLEQELREDRVTERHSLLYFMVFVVFYVVPFPDLHSSSESSWLTAIEDFLIPVSLLAMILASYRANRAGDGRRFLARFVALSCPIIIRLEVAFAVTYPLLMLGAASIALRLGVPKDVGRIWFSVSAPSNLTYLLLVFLFEILQAVWIYRSLGRVSRTSEPNAR